MAKRTPKPGDQHVAINTRGELDPRYVIGDHVEGKKRRKHAPLQKVTSVPDVKLSKQRHVQNRLANEVLAVRKRRKAGL